MLVALDAMGIIYETGNDTDPSAIRDIDAPMASFLSSIRRGHVDAFA